MVFLELIVPVLALALVVFVLWRHNRQRTLGPTVASTYVSEVTAIFYGSKRDELDHRDSMSMMRAEDAEGAPPGRGVDLETGTAVLRPDELRPRPATS